jgi:predicted nuclease of predicted toxin-antitoxin system
VRLKLDENLPRDLADELTRRGHDVDTVLDEQLGGRKDPVVVDAASDDDRMVITLDRGVGDIRNFLPGSHGGVLILRPVSQDPVSILTLVDRLLAAHELDEFSRCVAIVEPQRVRVRRPNDPDQR